MITIRVSGGLGNQLFQYSLAMYLKKKYGVNIELDVSSYENMWISNLISKKKKFSLRSFLLEDVCHNVFRTYSNSNQFAISRIASKICANYGFIHGLLVRRLYEDGDCRNDHSSIFENLDIKNRNYLVEGFWQNAIYLEYVRTELINSIGISWKDCSFQVQHLRNLIIQTNSIGIHVRRGDFVQLGWSQGIEYYINAMEYINNRIIDAFYFFFSDDISWVKDNFASANNCVFVSLENNPGGGRT